MARIQTTVGLITGIDIANTVSQLMEIAASRRDMLQERTDALEEEQTALTQLAALLSSVQYVAGNLGKSDLYDKRSATSSNSSTISVSVTGSPSVGDYQYTAIRTAQSHQLLSSGLKSKTESIGEGTLTFRFGDDVRRSAGLELFGGGEGLSRGSLRITDRAGDTATIDLTMARTVDDVLDAINSASDINVTAAAVGDSIRLVDNTGQTVCNLKVQEVGSGSTAASLGLAGIDVAADTADGADVLWLTRDTELDLLNDGTGVLRDTALADIYYQLRDGTEGYIDLSPIESGTSEEQVETTLGEIIDTINAQEPGKLVVEIAEDGDRLVLTDLTEGVGEFAVESAHDSRALAHLGLDGEAGDGLITGRRILGGVKTVLLSSLGGGNGLGQLGSVQLTDRSGASDTVDLSGAETLDDVIELVNAAGVDITARVNDAGTGILLTDTTGGTAANLVVANADGTGTADLLNIAVDAAATSVDSGDLHLQVVSHNTKLDELNGGAGVSLGEFTVIDSHGAGDTIDLATGDGETIGDVIQAINRSTANVYARINDTGDGILIEDLAGGSGTLAVVDGSTSTAADLHLTGDAVTVEIEGQQTQVIDGSTTYTIELDDETSLEDLVEQINALGAGVDATILSDGSSKPYRLQLTSQQSGSAGRLVVDSAQLGLSLDVISEGQDALMAIGSSTGVLVSSSTNRFTEVLEGVTLQIEEVSSSPVTVTVENSDSSLVASVSTMVDNYNTFREMLAELTSYDSDAEALSILTGDASARRLDNDLGSLLSGSFSNAGSIRSLAELGISFNDDGTLKFDEDRFTTLYAADPEAVETFFTESETGFTARFDALVEQLVGQDSSMLAYRLEALQDKIDQNEKKIKEMNARLDRQEQRLYTDFYQMELAIAKIQSSLDVIESIAYIDRYGNSSKKN